jgi:hypothetical protein
MKLNTLSEKQNAETCTQHFSLGLGVNLGSFYLFHFYFLSIYR